MEEQGDLKSCSEAIDRIEKYNELTSEYRKKSRETDNEYVKEYYDSRYNFYKELRELWQRKAKNLCKGVLSDKNCKYVANGLEEDYE